MWGSARGSFDQIAARRSPRHAFGEANSFLLFLTLCREGCALEWYPTFSNARYSPHPAHTPSPAPSCPASPPTAPPGTHTRGRAHICTHACTHARPPKCCQLLACGSARKSGAYASRRALRFEPKMQKRGPAGCDGSNATLAGGCGILWLCAGGGRPWAEDVPCLRYLARPLLEVRRPEPAVWRVLLVQHAGTTVWVVSSLVTS